jgi:peptide/nickel transport system substrate-binding protein
MTNWSLKICAAAAASALALGAAACGDDEDSGSSGGKSSAPTKADIPTGKTGGILKVSGASDTDYVDPGKTYYTTGYQLAFAIGRPLYGFKPNEDTPTPDLAESDPEISADKKTITVKLKKGVKFAPPVNREVTSKDVKYAIERAFSENVSGQYATVYFNSIAGAPEKLTKGVKPISGLETPDDQTLVIKLSSASAPVVSAALVMPITIPVPEEYAKPFDEKNPSTYNTHVVASGAYMVKNDAKGNLTGYKQGKSISLVRNPNWDKSTDFKPAYLDGAEWTTNASNAPVSAQQVLKGSHQAQEANAPAAELKLAVTRYKTQYQTVPAGGFRYFPLNTTIKPFDNLDVRKAVLAVFDRTAAVKARGGKFVGPVASHFIPPGIPGFEESGGNKGFGVDYLANPRGDMAVAEKYMKAAGYASGKYDGNDKFLMVTANVDPNKAQAQVAKAQLEKLGFQITLRQVPQDAVYTEWCQQPKKKVAICGGAGWFKDFQDPQSMLEPTFRGSAINPEGGNNNLAQLNDPKIDDAMSKAALLTGEERYKAWANVNKMIVADAPAVPFVWDNTTILFSKDVNPVVNRYYTDIDLSFVSFK